jgi:hypothetical protein
LLLLAVLEAVHKFVDGLRLVSRRFKITDKLKTRLHTYFFVCEATDVPGLF